MSSIVKTLRNLRGYTQEEVADAIGMSPKTYWKKERCPDLFTIGELKRLSIFLQVGEDIFFKKELAVSVS